MIHETIHTLVTCSVCRAQAMYFDPEEDRYTCSGCGHSEPKRH